MNGALCCLLILVVEVSKDYSKQREIAKALKKKKAHRFNQSELDKQLGVK